MTTWHSPSGRAWAPNLDGCLTTVGDFSATITAWDESHLTAAAASYLVDHINGNLLN